jgi:putative transposase
MRANRRAGTQHKPLGLKYTSGRFPNLGRHQSTGPACFDNSVAESWFATLKNEMYYRYRFPTRQRARFAVAQYIELFYNRKRHHSTLGYRTPAQAWIDHQLKAQAA